MSITTQAVLARWRLLAIAGVCLLMVAVKAWTLTHNQGYEPTQPIAFSHALHAGLEEGQLGMDCLYCHSNAEKSRHATVPPMETCMGCHSVVRLDRPEIQKLTEYYENDESVPWVRVWSLPDHVYFDHSAHVAAAVACQTCHGPVETMERVSQVVDHSMSWCMTCHRSDEYIKTPAKQHGPLVENRGEFESIVAETGGVWDDADLASALEGKSPEEMHDVIVKALGYDSLARQQGRRNVARDAIASLQNAPLNCSTCHQ